MNRCVLFISFNFVFSAAALAQESWDNAFELDENAVLIRDWVDASPVRPDPSEFVTIDVENFKPSDIKHLAPANRAHVKRRLSAIDPKKHPGMKIGLRFRTPQSKENTRVIRVKQLVRSYGFGRSIYVAILYSSGFEAVRARLVRELKLKVQIKLSKTDSEYLSTEQTEEGWRINIPQEFYPEFLERKTPREVFEFIQKKFPRYVWVSTSLGNDRIFTLLPQTVSLKKFGKNVHLEIFEALWPQMTIITFADLGPNGADGALETFIFTTCSEKIKKLPR